MKRLFVASALITSLWSVKSALAVTGLQLYEKCQAFGNQEIHSSSEQADIQFCGGYVIAAREFISLEQHRVEKGVKVPGYSICFPSDVGSREIILVYKKYMNEHPTMLHEYASIGVLNSFSSAYPCKS